MRLITTFLFLITIASCTKKEVPQKKCNAAAINKDSIKLIHRIDSLQSKDIVQIDLSDFKEMQLRNLTFKLIPVTLKGGTIDIVESQNDSLFNLTDEKYLAKWVLIAKKPKFFAITTEDGFLVTLNYNLKKLDAIRFSYTNPSSNNHWSFARQGKVDKNLTILLHHEYSVQVDENWNFETTALDIKFHITADGKIQEN